MVLCRSTGLVVPSKTKPRRSGANLSHANLSGADLDYANLRGTGLSKSGLTHSPGWLSGTKRPEAVERQEMSVGEMVR
jgi:hypothetical protein